MKTDQLMKRMNAEEWNHRLVFIFIFCRSVGLEITLSILSRFGPRWHRLLLAL